MLLTRLFRPWSQSSATPAATAVFHSPHYLRHNARRLEHLASLGIPVRGLSVLEVGAGIGDHSSYYLDRQCQLTITEGRGNNLALLRQRYPEANVQCLDLDQPQLETDAIFDVIHCYGVLYHLAQPAQALAFLAARCRGLLLLETCVSFGSELEVHLVKEDRGDPSQACGGQGCRPTRPWIVAQLRQHFEHVYIPRTQPNHPEFPLDWTLDHNPQASLSRAVFVAARVPLSNPLLLPDLPERQVRQE